MECNLYPLYSFKSDRIPKSAKPPKKPRHGSQASSRLLSPGLSFITSDKSQLSVSSLYNDSLRLSYFTQCFSVIRKIGEGSFGEVYKVVSLEDKKYYAIKKYKEKHRKIFDRQRGLEEVKKHERISKHDHCVELFLAWEENDYLFLQMELCEQNLDVYSLNNPHINEERLWNILLDILLGLKHLHDHDLIHLDIKLENVLLTSNNVCKLSDFGLTTDLSQVNLDELTEGDPKYIAPELFLGVFTKAADVFSLGLIMIELATNLDLPSGGAFWNFLRAGNLPYDLLTHISNELKSTIKMMIEPKHLIRPTVDRLLATPKLSELASKRLKKNFCRKLVEFIKKITRVFFDAVSKHLLKIWNKQCDNHLTLENKNHSFVYSVNNCDIEFDSFLTNSTFIQDVSSNTTPERPIPNHSTPIRDTCNTLNTCNLTPIAYAPSARRSHLQPPRQPSESRKFSGPRNLLRSFESLEEI